MMRHPILVLIAGLALVWGTLEASRDRALCGAALMISASILIGCSIIASSNKN